MRARLLAAAATLLPFAAFAQAGAPPAAPAITPDPAAPKGKLPDAATPRAYRLDLTIDPDQPRFSGHDEIDLTVKAPTAKLYMHGRALTVSRVVARVGGREVPATFTQVDPTGTARVDFASPLPAGPATLAFDYSGAFGEDASGLFHVQVAGKWYSWTQFESIDARAAYPSFDEPGYKQPFTISITTKPGYVAVSNAPEVSVTRAGALEKHQFAPTRPLPTYLVAMDAGPFAHPKGVVPPTPERAQPLPLGVVATQPQADKTDFVMAETPRIVSLLERYFGEPFPFPKLDQIGTPVMPGAMENAGADTYGDGIIFLDKGATVSQKQSFGMIVAHELSHQWFGDLVSPAWWDDIWLNESFANWMGYRVGNEWRPDLGIGVQALAEGFGAMSTDALEVGRPIHQPITENGQIDSAFDSITYGKGGHVISMIAAYLGDEKFQAGVRLHLHRHAYGNATSEQFFQSLADGAKDPRVLAAMKSFVDQQGVPVIDITRTGGRIVASQSRYAYLGSNPTPEQWTIPFCYRFGTTKNCALLDAPSKTLPAGAGVLMPNVGGNGYYRFNLPAADWQALIAAAPRLSPGEALAFDDSLWAAFRAGKAPAAWLIAAARTLADNPSAEAAGDGAARLMGLRTRGMVSDAALPAYRAMLRSIYAPKLTALGFNPAAGVYLNEAPDRQAFRETLVGLMFEAGDPGVTATLLAAGQKFVAGDTAALDQAYISNGLAMVVREGGVPAAKQVIERVLSSENPVLRQWGIVAVAASGRTDVAQYLFGLQDARLRGLDKLIMMQVMASVPSTIDLAGDWIIANFDQMIKGNGVFIASRVPGMLGMQCGADRADRIEATLGPKVRAANAGVLEFERTVESIRHCGVLKQAKQAEIDSAITGH